MQVPLRIFNSFYGAAFLENQPDMAIFKNPKIASTLLL